MLNNFHSLNPQNSIEFTSPKMAYMRFIVPTNSTNISPIVGVPKIWFSLLCLRFLKIKFKTSTEKYSMILWCY
jgi:hypothetical protein